MISKVKRVRNLVGTVMMGALAAGLTTNALAEEFSVESIMAGVTAPTQRECEALDNGLWIVVDGKGDCMRYWSSGLSENTPSAVFYMHGDRIWAGKNTSYADNTSAAQKEYAAATAAAIRTAFVKIGRPGLYGSSGAHAERRQMREMQLIKGAVDEIIDRHAIKRFGITGQSGGGSVAAYLLTQFATAECVALTSSALSLDALKKAGQGSDGYAYVTEGIYDPIAHLSEISVDPRRRIFVIGDELDEYALFPNQLEFYEAAKAAGHDITLIKSEGDYHHNLDVTGQHTVAWCLNGTSALEIEQKIAAKEVVY